MTIYISTNKPFVSNKRNTVFGQIRRILNPIKETTLKLINEKPILTSGAFLTFCTFFISLIGRSAVKILPFLGIPGIALLGYEIFSNLKYFQLKYIFHANNFSNIRSLTLIPNFHFVPIGIPIERNWKWG